MIMVEVVISILITNLSNLEQTPHCIFCIYELHIYLWTKCFSGYIQILRWNKIVKLIFIYAITGITDHCHIPGLIYRL